MVYRLLLLLFEWDAKYFLTFEQYFWVLGLSISEEAVNSSQSLLQRRLRIIGVCVAMEQTTNISEEKIELMKYCGIDFGTWLVALKVSKNQ